MSHRHQFHIARQVTFVCDGWFRSNRFWTGQIRPTKNRQEKKLEHYKGVPFHFIFESKKLLSVTNISHFPYEFSQKKNIMSYKARRFSYTFICTQILVPRKLFLKNILKIFCWSCHMESYFGGLQARTT